MHKNIKKIIAIALAVMSINAVSTVFNVNVQGVYASTYKARTNELESLEINSTNGNTLDLREDGFTGEIVDLSHDKEYYARLTDKSEGIEIEAEPEDEDQVVKVFLSDESDATPYNTNTELPISKGTTDIYIRIYDSSKDFRTAKSNKDYTDCEETYVIHILKTNASSNEDTTQDAIYLSSITFSGSKSIDFYKTQTSYSLKVDSDVDSIKITAKPEDTSSKVIIDGTTVDADDSYRKEVDLSKGTNEIKIKVLNDDYDVRTYTINITRGSSSSSQEDDIYLSDLVLDEGDTDLDFDEDDTSYTIDVDNDVTKMKIQAIPEDTDYLVTIDGEEVYESYDYETKVSLAEGKNTIPIIVKDEINDLTRKYTLIVNREESEDDDDEDTDTTTSESNTTTTTDTNSTSGQTSPTTTTQFSSYWVEGTNGYQYKKDDVIAKNKWILDDVSNKYYYVDDEGYRKTGWYKWNNLWYYMDKDGVMQTGWQNDGNAWYYLNSNGDMRTGWLKDTDEKWYYLNANGSMKTGWLKYNNKWYYMNTSGAMQTGWLTDGDKKYYLNTDGDMVVGTTTIDGKTYEFNNSGALVS